MDYETASKKLEIAQYHLLKSYFQKGLTRNLAEQVETILDAQFQASNYSEVGGAVFRNGENVSLRIVKPQFMQDLESAILAYQQDTDEEARKILYEHARITLGAKQTYLEGSLDLEAINLFIDYFSEPRTPSVKLRNTITHWYKVFFLGTYAFSRDELGFREDDFLAAFHVHDDYSEPSPMDINENKRNHLLNLVISANDDYKKSEVNLYLIYAGAFELLYQGPLTTT